MRRDENQPGEVKQPPTGSEGLPPAAPLAWKGFTGKADQQPGKRHNGKVCSFTVTPYCKGQSCCLPSFSHLCPEIFTQACIGRGGNQKGDWSEAAWQGLTSSAWELEYRGDGSTGALKTVNQNFHPSEIVIIYLLLFIKIILTFWKVNMLCFNILTERNSLDDPKLACFVCWTQLKLFIWS